MTFRQNWIIFSESIFFFLQGLISTGHSFPNSNIRTVQVQLENAPSNYSQIRVNKNPPPPPPAAAAAPPGPPGPPAGPPAPSYDVYLQQGQRSPPRPPIAPRASAQVNKNKNTNLIAENCCFEVTQVLLCMIENLYWKLDSVIFLCKNNHVNLIIYFH